MDNRALKRAQVSLQFMLLISFMFFVYLAFVSYNASQTIEKQRSRQAIMTHDLALKIGAEINLASRMQDGYTRTFTLPNTLEGASYTLTRAANDILVTTTDAEYSVTIPDITGSLVIGNNTITKINGVLYITN